MSESNPIQEWVLSCARESGSPERLAEEAKRLSSGNSREILLRFAVRWSKRLRLSAWLGQRRQGVF